MRYGASNAVHICIGVTEKSIHTEKFIQRACIHPRISSWVYLYHSRSRKSSLLRESWWGVAVWYITVSHLAAYLSLICQFKYIMNVMLEYNASMIFTKHLVYLSIIGFANIPILISCFTTDNVVLSRCCVLCKRVDWVGGLCRCWMLVSSVQCMCCVLYC